jgi:hypothetical protein
MVNWLDKDAASEAVKANGDTNCPNCGAPITSEKCPYCGTVFIDFACMNADEPFFMKIKHKDEIHVVKVFMNSLSYNVSPITLCSDGYPYLQTYGDREISMDFTVVN